MGSNVGAVTPMEEMIQMARRIAASQLCKHNPKNISAQNILNGSADSSLPVQIALTAIMEVSEAAAKVAESAFDDRGNGRSGHHSEMDWTDGYRDATRAAATAIRNGEHLR